eukprot:Gb_23403 [translate_table: standard]
MASITNILPQFYFRTLLVVTIFLALAEGSVTKCSRPQKCGNLTVNYPFGIKNSACIAHDPGFEIICKENSSLGRGLLPFLPTPSGDFQILNISNGTLIINSTSLKAMSCNGTDDARKVLQLPKDGPFTISNTNVFAVIGCSSIGSFISPVEAGLPGGGVGKCQAACLNQDEPKYCNAYGCCSAGIPGNWQWINFTGGGIHYQYFENCGFSTILEPETFSTLHRGWIGSGQYGLKLDWAIGNLNCSIASPGCSQHAICSDRRNGYICNCQEGYEGDGYSNGTGCTG